MKNIIFIAPPAGGKGTQSETLVEKMGYIHISTGDLLREMDKTTPLGQEIDKLMKEGKFASDELIFELLKEKLSNIGNKPFILDGVPRNINQADMLNKMLSELKLDLGAVIYLDVEYDLLLKRAIGRLNCPKCKATYNKYFKKPAAEGICDKCGGELVSRTDDNEETFKTRFDTYMEMTAPLIEYYENMDKLVRLDGAKSDVFEDIVRVISND